MRAAVIHGAGDIRIEDVPDPVVQHPTDALVRVVLTCICGSDLHPYRSLPPDQGPSRIGHEFIGIVEDTGPEVASVRKGDLVVAPFAYSDGTCEFCRQGLQTSCLNGGYWGLGGVDGGQGEAVRVPLADGTLVRLPVEADSGLLPSLLTLSDVYGTGWHAATTAGVKAGMSVTVRWQPDVKRLLLDVQEQRTYPIQLSVESRTITNYRVTRRAPTATRVIVGDGASFQQVTNATVEQQFGPLLRGETFRQATTTDEASTAATEALNEGNAKSGMSVSLAESPFVRYGGPNGLRVGDRATLHVGDVEITDVVREAVIEWRAGQPLTITPGVGAWEDSPSFALAAAVARIGSTVRRALSR